MSDFTPILSLQACKIPEFNMLSLDPLDQSIKLMASGAMVYFGHNSKGASVYIRKDDQLRSDKMFRGAGTKKKEGVWRIGGLLRRFEQV